MASIMFQFFSTVWNKIKWPILIVLTMAIGVCTMISLLGYCVNDSRYSRMKSQLASRDPDTVVLMISTEQGKEFINRAFDALETMDRDQVIAATSFDNKDSDNMPYVSISGPGMSRITLKFYQWDYNHVCLVPRNAASYRKISEQWRKRGKALRLSLYAEKYDLAPKEFLRATKR